MPQDDKDSRADALTIKILSEGEMVDNFVQSDGWRWVKDRFTQKIMDLQSIKNLDKSKTATMLQREIIMRENVVEVLMEIIKEVEGRAAQHRGNKPLGQSLVDEHIGFVE